MRISLEYTLFQLNPIRSKNQGKKQMEKKRMKKVLEGVGKDFDMIRPTSILKNVKIIIADTYYFTS